MNNLYLRLKQDHLQARKNKDEKLKDFLGYILSELDKDLISRRTEDEQNKLATDFVIAFEKQNLRAVENFKHDPRTASIYQNEIDMIKPYLPQKLTEDEIKALVDKYTLDTLPKAMKYLSANHKGLFDPKVVQAMYK